MMPNLCLHCWTVGKEGFSAIKQRRSGEHCLFVTCRTFGMKETNGSLMELSILVLQSKKIFLRFLFDWMCALGGISSISFIDYLSF